MAKAYLIFLSVVISFTSTHGLIFDSSTTTSTSSYSNPTTTPTTTGSRLQCIPGQTYCQGQNLCCYNNFSSNCFTPNLRQGTRLSDDSACFPNEVRFPCFCDEGHQCCEDYLGCYQPTPKHVWSPYRECSHRHYQNRCKPNTLCRARYDPVSTSTSYCAYSFTYSPECINTTFTNPFSSLCYAALNGSVPSKQSVFYRKVATGLFYQQHENRSFMANVDCADGPENAWLLIQRRYDGSVNFSRNWYDYENGFGNPYGEFWLGLKAIRNFTKNENYEIRVDLKHLNRTEYAISSSFSISGPSRNYQLHAQGSRGTVGSELTYNNGAYFSTRDRVNYYAGANCGEQENGGWWFFRGSGQCGDSNLNGKYFADGRISPNVTHNGLYWVYGFSLPTINNRYSLTATEMKIRRIK